ncbi:Pectin lyase fold/virulence factor [Pseudocohnilembus persalinus]|uniref:Pectin lyase fold/virulence factor n=1 Tax=Pseudocohnilembus persalinus TaxID=266149 RepID=A0A0V0R1S0_PSEPJ|nr:Pectin lyase fold/virulence factor [Pseudocohnilembus persalinus]|eukprot:KRX08101.1 Pectin lyase fold/virulence factor [Pseudocohnilembus persalinus]
MDVDQFFISACNFSNNIVQNGIVNLKNMYKSSGNYNIHVNNTVFNNNTGEYNGIYISSAQIPIIFNNITISENKKGQSIYLYNLYEAVNIINSNFQKNEYEDKSGSCLNAEFVDILILNNLNISYNMGYKSNFYIYQNSDLIFANSIVSNNTGYSSSGVHVQYSWQSQIYNIQFTNNYAEDESTALNLYSCDYSEIYNLTFEDNISGNSFGAFLLEYSYFDEIRDLTFKRNQAQQKGTSFALITAYQSTFKNIHIQDSVALGQNGALYIEQGSYVDFYNVTIFNCTTDDKNGGGIYAYLPKFYTLINSTFYDNHASIGGAVSIYSAQNFTLENIDFKNNSARSYGGALHIDKGDSYLNNITFYGNQVDQHGGAIYLESIIHVEILNSSFINNQCSFGNGGALNIQSGQEIILQNNILSQNIANLGSGGAIYADRAQILNILNSQLHSNMKAEQGGALYLFSFREFLINNTQIYDHNDETQIRGGAIYLQNGDKIQFLNSKISNNQAQFYGGAIFCNNLKSFFIYKTMIENNFVYTTNEDISEKGGALFIDIVKNLTLEQSSFNNNSAQEQGGAINLENAEILNIQKSTFEFNSVQYDNNSNQYEKRQGYQITKGGGIYYNLQQQNTLNQFQILIQESIFKNNIASSGGAIMIQLDPSYNVNFNFENLKFQGNIADIGPGIRFLGDNEDYFKNLNQQSEYLLDIYYV